MHSSTEHDKKEKREESKKEKRGKKKKKQQKKGIPHYSMIVQQFQAVCPEKRGYGGAK